MCTDEDLAGDVDTIYEVAFVGQRETTPAVMGFRGPSLPPTNPSDTSSDSTLHSPRPRGHTRLTESIWHRQRVKGFPGDLFKAARRKLGFLEDAVELKDLRIPPGNRLEALKGDRNETGFDRAIHTG